MKKNNIGTIYPSRQEQDGMFRAIRAKRPMISSKIYTILSPIANFVSLSIVGIFLEFPLLIFVLQGYILKVVQFESVF